MKRYNCFLLFIIAFNLQASQITVPKDFPKIQDAIDKIEQGDTIFVKDGIYKESLVLKDDITIIGQSAQKTIIRGSFRKPVIKAGDKALIKNLTVENGKCGILCENVIPTIQNCIIRDNKGTGIHCLITLPEIRNCLILSNDWTGIYCESARSIKSLIQHNIIAENGYSGIMLSGNSEVLIQNNVFFGNKQYGIWTNLESKKTRIVYNDFFLNRSPNNVFALVDKSNIYEDPQYPYLQGKTHNYYGYESPVLKGKGKDGVIIGMMNEADLIQIITDSDMDGVPNDKDLCKDIPEDIDHFQDDDGCPDFDNDKDGIFDNQDLCPDSAEDFDNYRDDDGCPDRDNDNDGVVDSLDLCPSDKETINGYKDDDGCPDELPSINSKPDSSNIQSSNSDKKEPSNSSATVNKAVKATTADTTVSHFQSAPDNAAKIDTISKSVLPAKQSIESKKDSSSKK